jgi:Caspase domain
LSRKFALLIGNDQFDDPTLKKLKAPSADVKILESVLKDPMVGAFDYVTLQLNKPWDELQTAIARFFADKLPDDLLLLYFSTHGVKDAQGRLYLASRNTQKSLLSGSSVATKFITDRMNESSSMKKVLILDCCFSGAFVRGIIGIDAITETTFVGDGYGRAVLTATTATDYAFESDQVIGNTEDSLFTHYLVEGIKTYSANVNNRLISIEELYNYVYKKIINKQKPLLWYYGLTGDLIIIGRSSIENFEFTPVEENLGYNNPDLSRQILYNYVETCARKSGIILEVIQQGYLGELRRYFRKLWFWLSGAKPENGDWRISPFETITRFQEIRFWAKQILFGYFFYITAEGIHFLRYDAHTSTLVIIVPKRKGLFHQADPVLSGYMTAYAFLLIESAKRKKLIHGDSLDLLIKFLPPDWNDNESRAKQPDGDVILNPYFVDNVPTNDDVEELENKISLLFNIEKRKLSWF